MDQQLGDVRVRREPIFNVPTAVVATLAVLVLVHVVREWVLTQRQDAQLLLLVRIHSGALRCGRDRQRPVPWRDLGRRSGPSSPTR